MLIICAYSIPKTRILLEIIQQNSLQKSNHFRSHTSPYFKVIKNLIDALHGTSTYPSPCCHNIFNKKNKTLKLKKKKLIFCYYLIYLFLHTVFTSSSIKTGVTLALELKVHHTTGSTILTRIWQAGIREI